MKELMKLNYQRGTNGQLVITNEKDHDLAYLTRRKDELLIACQIAASGDLLAACELAWAEAVTTGYLRHSTAEALKAAIAKANPEK
jgi:hypothetical protein